MTKGISLHIGLNSVDPNHYSGWTGPLMACEADAQDMFSIAFSKGIKSEILLTKNATREKVILSIREAAASAQAGDYFLMSYSGHGGQVPDYSADEPDGLDETWCLYDGQLIDDEVDLELTNFADGVRIFVLSDSCHSGSAIKNRYMEYFLNTSRVYEGVSYRNMPIEICSRVYYSNKDFYDNIIADTARKKAGTSVVASAILISGCQDNQLSKDGAFNGAFTGALKAVWNGGKFKGNYKAFRDGITAAMGDPTQTPNLFFSGKPNLSFEAQVPFSV